MANEVTVEATGLVYENPQPAAESVAVQHPSLVLLSEGEMLVTFDIDHRYRTLDYRTMVSRSTDGGRSWDLEGPLLRDPPPSTTHSIRTSRLADGSLIGLGLVNRIEDPEAAVVSSETLGRIPGDMFLVRSSDDGRTWTGLEIIDTPLVGPSWEICHPVLELSGGRLLAPTATWRGLNGENPSGDQSPVFISEDGGRTWPDFGRSFDGRETGLTHWEQSVVELRDGRLLAVAWVYRIESGRTYPSVYSISKDRGESFSEPAPTGFHAQTCKVIELGDGRVLCVYRRHDLPGLWAGTARLRGDRWQNLAHVPLWQGAESGMTGEGKGGDEIKGLKFGYPSMKQLPSGEVFLVFWCEEEGAQHIRWMRLRA